MSEELVAGRYRLLEPLGRGAMSAVWAADDLELARRVAVKMLAPVVWGEPKIGMKPRWSCSHGSMWPCAKGARMRIPQKPRMTLGIAASISTSGPTSKRTGPGASMLR